MGGLAVRGLALTVWGMAMKSMHLWGVGLLHGCLTFFNCLFDFIAIVLIVLVIIIIHFLLPKLILIVLH